MEQTDAISRTRVLSALEAEKGRLIAQKGNDWPFTGEILAKAVDTVIDFIKQVPALDVAPKWISVKERLPKNGELVLITMSGQIDKRKLFNHAYELACYWRDGEDEEGEYHLDGWELWDYREGEVSDLEVFYWMPLPQPPKEK